MSPAGPTTKRLPSLSVARPPSIECLRDKEEEEEEEEQQQ
jgi:hypothetical protein